MYKLLGFLFISAVVISCGKDNDFSNNFSSAAFINAAPSTGSTIPSLNIYVDTFLQTSIGYRSASGYLSLAPGTRKIQLKNSGDPLPLRTFVSLPAESFTTNTASTFVVYDTISASNPTLKVVRLNDTLTIPPTGFVKVRFLPLAPKAPSLDVTFLRTNVTPNDSVTFTNLAYIGATPNVQALSAFTTIPLGTYTVKLKAAGTQTIIPGGTALSVANLAGVGGITGISTVYVTGGVQGQPVSLGIFRHYP